MVGLMSTAAAERARPWPARLWPAALILALAAQLATLAAASRAGRNGHGGAESSQDWLALQAFTNSSVELAAAAQHRQIGVVQLEYPPPTPAPGIGMDHIFGLDHMGRQVKQWNRKDTAETLLLIRAGEREEVVDNLNQGVCPIRIGASKKTHGLGCNFGCTCRFSAFMTCDHAKDKCSPAQWKESMEKYVLQDCIAHVAGQCQLHPWVPTVMIAIFAVSVTVPMICMIGMLRKAASTPSAPNKRSNGRSGEDSDDSNIADERPW